MLQINSQEALNIFSRLCQTFPWGPPNKPRFTCSSPSQLTSALLPGCHWIIIPPSLNHTNNIILEYALKLPIHSKLRLELRWWKNMDFTIGVLNLFTLFHHSHRESSQVTQCKSKHSVGRTSNKKNNRIRITLVWNKVLDMACLTMQEVVLHN